MTRADLITILMNTELEEHRNLTREQARTVVNEIFIAIKDALRNGEEPRHSYTDHDMSETRDKRRRTDLDLFVLALIDGGVSTPYQLQKAAGLSQGATNPALQRLMAARFVRQGKPGARGRTDYKVTAAGRKLLQDGWLPLIEAGPSGDLDSDLRVALLAIRGSGDRRLAVDFLRESGDKKMESIAAIELTSDAASPLARWYADLRSATVKALVTNEAEAIRAVADALPRKLTGKPKRGGGAVKRQKRKKALSAF